MRTGPLHWINSKQKLIFVLTAVIVFLLIVVSAAVSYAGKWLVVDDPLQKVDVIVVLSGDRGERVEHAVDLYKKGYADKLLITGGIVYDNITICDLMAEHAIRLGVPPEAIIREEEADSTYENAVLSKDMLQEMHIKKAIIVSSNYHMRRVKLTFDRVYSGSGVVLIYSPAIDRNYDAINWWKDNKGIMFVINEYVKIVGYYMKY